MLTAQRHIISVIGRWRHDGSGSRGPFNYRFVSIIAAQKPALNVLSTIRPDLYLVCIFYRRSTTLPRRSCDVCSIGACRNAGRQLLTKWWGEMSPWRCFGKVSSNLKRWDEKQFWRGLQTFVRSLELVFGYIDLKLHIHKKGAKHYVSNFRHISLLPLLFKYLDSW